MKTFLCGCLFHFKFTFWNCLNFKLDNGLKIHFKEKKEREQKDRWTQTFCEVLCDIFPQEPQAESSEGFGFTMIHIGNFGNNNQTTIPLFSPTSPVDDFGQGIMFTWREGGRGFFAKEKLEIKIQTKPLWLTISYGKFIQTWKYKVLNNCKVSVTFHVYKHEDKKMFCSKEAGAYVELWDRQLEAAWLSREQEDK